MFYNTGHRLIFRWPCYDRHDSRKVIWLVEAVRVASHAGKGSNTLCVDSMRIALVSL